MEALFWTLVALIVYSLAGYGAIWIVLAKLIGRRETAPTSERPQRATMLIAARNEEDVIAEKLRAVLAQDVGPHQLDVLVVSDGSEDATLPEAQSVGSDRIRAFQTETHGGKAAALTAGLREIDADIVVFSDANSIPAPGALRALLASFSVEEVGGAIGRPLPANGAGDWIGEADRAFWNYDTLLKQAESALGGVVSANGALYAMRRSLVPAVVPPAMADDFFISVQAVDQGRRLVFAPKAVALEEVTDRTHDEFMRRVRSTERGWRALMNMARLMNPLRTAGYALQLFSHKFLRRMVAFMLPLLLLATIALWPEHVFYQAALVAQVLFCAVGLAGSRMSALRKLPGVGFAAFFVLGHIAMAYGVLRVALGVKSARWSPVRGEAV